MCLHVRTTCNFKGLAVNQLLKLASDDLDKVGFELNTLRERQETCNELMKTNQTTLTAWLNAIYQAVKPAVTVPEFPRVKQAMQKQVHTWFPTEVTEMIEAKARLRGISASELIRQAVWKALHE